MKTPTSLSTSHRPLADPTRLLRWVFHRGAESLTCAIETAASPTSYDVCILPHWNLEVASVEPFPVAKSAMRRHAEIASRLRQAGWVAEYGSTHPTQVA